MIEGAELTFLFLAKSLELADYTDVNNTMLLFHIKICKILHHMLCFIIMKMYFQLSFQNIKNMLEK